MATGRAPAAVFEEFWDVWTKLLAESRTPGTVVVGAEAAMVVVAMVTGVKAGIGDELVRSLDARAVVPLGQPWTVVEIDEPRMLTVALESNSVI